MSKLRECDRHGGSFSERNEGWAEGNIVIHRRFDDGSPNDERRAIDLCAECVKIMSGENPVPYKGGVWEGDARSAYPKELTGDPYGPHVNEGYVQQMERQNHIGEVPPLFESDADEPARPGDKITDPVSGQVMTVLEPERPGIPCHCGNPMFQEHYHNMMPAQTPVTPGETQEQYLKSEYER